MGSFFWATSNDTTMLDWLYRTVMGWATEVPLAIAAFLGFTGIVTVSLMAVIGYVLYMFNPFPPGRRAPTRPPHAYTTPRPFTVRLLPSHSPLPPLTNLLRAEPSLATTQATE